jgi:hypothetical protein
MSQNIPELLSDLEIKDKSYRNSGPVLSISFTLKNESKTEIYTALSPSSRITNLSRSTMRIKIGSLVIKIYMHLPTIVPLDTQRIFAMDILTDTVFYLFY